MTSVLPAPEEYAELAPRPGSPVWRAFNDVRMLSSSGYATLLQVAHPTVGHGVHQYSSFTKDPWGRLLRTLDYVHGTIYGGPELAGSIGRRVREMHRTIRGTMPDGEAYHAMEPGAFAWVHATLAAAVVHGRATFAEPMTRPEKEELWEQWREVGRLVGVRPRDLPETWAGFEDYFAGVVADELVWTPAVPEVLETLAHAAPPNLPGMHPALWRVLRTPMAMQLRVTTIGMLPRELRDRLGVRLTRSEARTFRALAAASRRSSPLIRGPLAEFGPTYVRWRREALARGDVASRPPAPQPQSQSSRVPARGLRTERA
ncbi:MAG: hypothetical protein JWM71_2532 [Solirubrobacteraceae bacterium]|nr:hypothetical protein [Solirubrobacteraceae bacterium]